MTAYQIFFLSLVSLIFVSCGRQSQNEATGQIPILQAANGKYYAVACLKNAQESTVSDCEVPLSADRNSTPRGARSIGYSNYSNSYGNYSNSYGNDSNSYANYSNPSSNYRYAPDFSLYFLLNLSQFDPFQMCSQFRSPWSQPGSCYRFLGHYPYDNASPGITGYSQPSYQCQFPQIFPTYIYGRDPFSMSVGPSSQVAMNFQNPSCGFPGGPNWWVGNAPFYRERYLLKAEKRDGNGIVTVTLWSPDHQQFARLTQEHCRQAFLQGQSCSTDTQLISLSQFQSLRQLVQTMRDARRYYQPGPVIQLACTPFQENRKYGDYQDRMIESDCRGTLYQVPGAATQQLKQFLDGYLLRN